MYFSKALFSLSLFLLPAVSFAAPLVPNCSFTATGNYSGNYSAKDDYMRATACGLCDLAQLVQNIVNFLVMVSIPISVAMFAWAGILFFTSAANPKQIGRAKKLFQNVVIGFVIVVSGWVVVQAILQAVTKQDYFTIGSWTNLQCASSGERPRDKTLNDVLSGVSVASTPAGGCPSGYTPTGSGTCFNETTGDFVNPTTPTSGPGGGGGGGPAITPITVGSVGPNGVQTSVALATTRTDENLRDTYDRVQAQYGDKIQSSCSTSSLPNCREVVTATIVAESNGVPTAVSSAGARGLMQAMPGSPGYTCAATDTQCQIDAGTGLLSVLYSQTRNLTNTFAGYNSGSSNNPYPDGRKPGLANSTDCPGLYAWQCATNPGGLAETRGYVANICQTLFLKGKSC